MSDPVNPSLNYDWSVVRVVGNARGLTPSEALTLYADQQFKAYGLDQAQATGVGLMWVNTVANIFNRRNYSLWQRFTAALYWLGLTPNPVK